MEKTYLSFLTDNVSVYPGLNISQDGVMKILRPVGGDIIVPHEDEQ